MAVVGFVVANALGAPDLVTGGILLGFGIVVPTVRDEWRRRKDA